MPDTLEKIPQTALAVAPERLPTVGETPGELLSAIVLLAKDPSVDVAKLDALLHMQERMEGRQAEAEFNRAFHLMEPKLPRIKRNGEVEYQGKKAFKFARFEDVDAGIRPILREHGFSLSFDTQPAAGGLVITGTLLHTAGHSRSASVPLPLDTSGGKNNLQGVGSTFSYGKRYATQMLLNIVTEGQDDNGYKGGNQFITEKQVAELRKLLAETKSDEIRFLEWAGLAELQDIAASEYTRLRNTLESKKHKLGAAA